MSPLVEVERKIFDVAGGPDVRTHRAAPAVRSGAIEQKPLLSNKIQAPSLVK
jgi:hypothetical protein